MAIHVVTGLPGSSKTTLLVAKGLELLKEGLKVYSNIVIDTTDENFHYWTELEQLSQIREGVILFDEVQVLLESREWFKMPAVIRIMLQQHRKEGLHIWGATQRMSRIDVAMRQLVTNYYVIKKIVLPFKADKLSNYALVIVSEYDPDDWEKKERKVLQRKWYLGRSRIIEQSQELPKTLEHAYSKFDTLKRIG